MKNDKINIDIRQDICDKCKELRLSGKHEIYIECSNYIENKYGIRLDTEYIRGIVRNYREKYHLNENFIPYIDAKENQEKYNISKISINSNGESTQEKIICLKNNEQLTPELLLKKHGFDPTKFILTSSQNTMRDVSRKGEKDVYYMSKVSVKPTNKFIWTIDNIEKLFSNIDGDKFAKSYREYKEPEGNNMLVVPIADIHYNLLTTTLNSDTEYNPLIAKELFLNAINEVIERCRDKSISKILFPFGNDGLNSDIKHTTTKGTPQDDAIDWEQSVISFTDMLIQGIEKLSMIAPVDVVLINSNHDYYTMFGIANALRLYYMNDEMVNVDYSPFPRKYITFGNTLIMIAHDVKPDLINGLIQMEARELISQTTNSIALLAHLHHETVVDKNGTDVRRLSTFCARSKWTVEMGYGSRRKTQAFIINKDFGITDVLYIYPNK